MLCWRQPHYGGLLLGSTGMIFSSRLGEVLEAVIWVYFQRCLKPRGSRWTCQSSPSSWGCMRGCASSSPSLTPILTTRLTHQRKTKLQKALFSYFQLMIRSLFSRSFGIPWQLKISWLSPLSSLFVIMPENKQKQRREACVVCSSPHGTQESQCIVLLVLTDTTPPPAYECIEHLLLSNLLWHLTVTIWVLNRKIGPSQ